MNRIKIAVKNILSIYRYMIAEYTFKQLLKRKGPDEVYMFTSCSIGDVIYVCAYLYSFKNSHLSKHIIVYAPEKFKWIVDSYSGYDEVRYLKSGSKEEKRILKCLNASTKVSRKMLRHDCYNLIPGVYYGWRAPADALTMLRKILQLPKDSYVKLPEIDMYDIQLSIKNSLDKIVVLNAYASNLNVSEINEELEWAARYLSGKGYYVYSNVIDGQEPTKGTIPLKCSLKEFYALADAVPIIISIRTGLIDLVLGTSSSKVILYGTVKGGEFYKMFSLGSWNQDNIYEINKAEKNSFQSFVNVVTELTSKTEVE